MLICFDKIHSPDVVCFLLHRGDKSWPSLSLFHRNRKCHPEVITCHVSPACHTCLQSRVTCGGPGVNRLIATPCWAMAMATVFQCDLNRQWDLKRKWFYLQIIFNVSRCWQNVVKGQSIWGPKHLAYFQVSNERKGNYHWRWSLIKISDDDNEDRNGSME